MKHLLKLLSFFLILVIFSCQKELSLENPAPAQGSLQTESTGECLPKTVAGTYVSGRALGDSNFIEVEILVTTPGSYTVQTDLVNGYSFKGTGNITATGIIRIQLKGTGTPVVDGTDVFTVTFDSTTCTIPVTVLQGSTSGGPAVFTLSQGAGGICMDASVSGSYVKNVALTSTNQVSIKLNVTTAGTYTVSTNSVNGYSFSGSGTVAGTGTQTIILTATGTPVNEGTDTFTVTAGTSTCTFTVTVTPTGIQGDYFPLTAGSWWSYDDMFFPGDTLKMLNATTATIGSNTYRLFKEYDNDEQVVDTSYYRRAGDDYFDYTYTDAFTGSLFDVEQKEDLLFLKQTLATGETWTQGPYTGTINGINTSLRYIFTCTNANASVTVNGKSFTNVYHITINPEKNNGSGYVATGEVIEMFYAKGIGLIDTKITVPGAPLFRIPIRNWLVN